MLFLPGAADVQYSFWMWLIWVMRPQGSGLTAVYSSHVKHCSRILVAVFSFVSPHGIHSHCSHREGNDSPVSRWNSSFKGSAALEYMGAVALFGLYWYSMCVKRLNYEK